MEWILAALKVLGIVGAFIGLADRAKQEKQGKVQSDLRRSAPFLFLAIAVGAEFVDAYSKHKDAEKQESHFEQIALPISKMTIEVSETLPYASILAVAPAYGKRIAHYSNVDIVRNRAVGALPLYAEGKDFPRRDVEGEAKVWLALNAFYEIDLAFYRGAKDTTLDTIDSQKLTADFKIPLYGNPRRGKAAGIEGILTDARTSEHPPEGREWAFTRVGIRVSDDAAKLNLNDLVPGRHLRSIADLKNAKLVLELCPRTGGDETQLEELHDEQATEVAKLIQQVTMNVNIEGVGVFDISNRQFRPMPMAPQCIRLYYSFPDSETDLHRLFGL